MKSSPCSTSTCMISLHNSITTIVMIWDSDNVANSIVLVYTMDKPKATSSRISSWISGRLSDLDPPDRPAWLYLDKATKYTKSHHDTNSNYKEDFPCYSRVTAIQNCNRHGHGAPKEFRRFHVLLSYVRSQHWCPRQSRHQLIRAVLHQDPRTYQKRCHSFIT